MSCPFLREADVRYCEIAPFRKMIPRQAQTAATGRCSSPDYMGCPWVGSRSGTPVGALRCPFLREAMVQYCGAAAVTRFIPHSDALHSFCQSEGYRYCDLYRDLAEAGGDRAGDVVAAPLPPEHCFDTLGAAPSPVQEAACDTGELSGLVHAANHMWLDLRSDGSWHLGLDAFFADIMGHLDALTLTSRPGLSRPAVMVTVRGVALPMVFPHPLEIVVLNAALRGDPDRVVRDPYRSGWLYAGRSTGDAAAAGGGEHDGALRSGMRGRTWMVEERARLDRFVRDQSAGGAVACLNDGGAVRMPLAPYLAPDDLLRLFEAFLDGGRQRETA